MSAPRLPSSSSSSPCVQGTFALVSSGRATRVGNAKVSRSAKGHRASRPSSRTTRPPRSRGQDVSRFAAAPSSLSEAFEIGVQDSEETISVPIDYYKVLGLGSQRHASSEELERAYATRVAVRSDDGLPFSDDAVEGRLRILDLVRQALSSRSPSRSRLRMKSSGGEGGIALRPTHESVSLPLSWLSGVALLLLEVGDFENCVAIGTGLLEQSRGFAWPAFAQPSEAEGQAKAVRLSWKQRRDVSLAVALSHCELAKVHLDTQRRPFATSAASTSPSIRARKEKRRVAEGCAHLNSALTCLKLAPGRPKLMPVLSDEIEKTLERLVAPCALDHLRLPLDEIHAETRKQAALVLEDLLLDETSNRDENLTRGFVLSATQALTAREYASFLPWKSLEMSHYPWYDLKMVYSAAMAAMVAGFADSDPRQVMRGLDLIEKLEGDIEASAADSEAWAGLDLASEKACALVLLGRVQEAVSVLEEAEERGGGSIRELETISSGRTMGLPTSSSMMLTFIRMQGGEDLLQGICIFVKSVLVRASEAFRDSQSDKLGQRKVEDYFESPSVRRYCALPLYKIMKSVEIPAMPPLEWKVVAKWAAMLGLGLGLLTSLLSPNTSAPAKRTPAPPPTTTSQPTNIQVGTRVQPARPIPASVGPQMSWSELRKDTLSLINKWQSIKSLALGRDHRSEGLPAVLGPQLLADWRDRVVAAKRGGLYWRYRLASLKLVKLEKVEGGGDVRVATVRIDEKAELVERATGRTRSSYKDPYTVSYTIVGGKIIKIKLL